MRPLHKYKSGDYIITIEGLMGEIKDCEYSVYDSKNIPSYWVKYPKMVHPDGYPRNTWETSIEYKLGWFDKFVHKYILRSI